MVQPKLATDVSRATASACIATGRTAVSRVDARLDASSSVVAGP